MVAESCGGRRAAQASAGALVLLVALLLPAPSTAASMAAMPPAGRFYTEAGGDPGLGYLIADGRAGKFWSSFQELGGVATLGFPASQPYRDGGFTYQATQGGILQWRPELGRALLANTFEQLSDAGNDDVLYRTYQVPLPIRDDGSNGVYASAVATRLGWLTDAEIASRFRANPNPQRFRTWTLKDSIQLYGLPMSKPQAFGPFVSQRFQRIAFQHWLKPAPGMPAPGSVVRVLGGDLAKKLALVPERARWAQLPPGTDVADASWPSPRWGPSLGRDDLLRDVPVLEEGALNQAACGVSAAAMVVDYYMLRAGSRRALPSVPAVSAYVKQWYVKRGGATIPGGTSFEQLQTGVQAASAAAGVPLTARWVDTAGPDAWLLALKSDLERNRPAIVYLADGGMLWRGAWHYGHYVVASGFTQDGQIIYHDPWDGRAHAIPARDFGAVWGASWRDNPSWRYLRIAPMAPAPAR